MVIIKKFRKFFFPAFVVMASFYISLAFLFGIIIGYILTMYFHKKAKPIKFSLGGYKIHLHHWFYAAFGFAVVLISGIYQILPPFLLGLGGGVVFHGIYSYNNWYKIIYREK